MENTAPSRLRLTILGGPLTKDKAVWLAAQVEAGVFGEALVVFSDAAPHEHANFFPLHRASFLPKGCACCGGKAGLLTSLRNIVENRHLCLAPFDHIVLEAGGNADLDEVAATLQSDPTLKSQIVVSETVVTLTCGPDVFDDEPLLQRQLEVADCVVLTAQSSAGLAPAIRAINQHVRIYGP